MIRNKFSLSHTRLLSCDMGELIPCGVIDILPGDGVQMSSSAFVRCAPMVTPPMHPVDVRIHHWFVPWRLVWEDFEDLITGGPDGMDTSVWPTITLASGGSGAVGGLADYLGTATGVNYDTDATIFRAYAMVFNEWYRDQDLQTELPISLASGADSTTSTALQNCGWEKDYFTSSRPWEQKGPSITIPIGSAAPVKTLAADSVDLSILNTLNNYVTMPTNGVRLQKDSTAGTSGNRLFADLSSASAITINALREALALQRYMEARARYGSRYPEYLRALGVLSSDARLQIPEYLGGGRDTIQFSEVLQTAEGTNPVGELRGHGIAGMRTNRFRRAYFEEHGWLLSLLSVRPKTIYQNGSPRMFNRRTKEDVWQKELQFIGQQEVLFKEANAGHATPDGTFGFQDRYDEYRRKESSVHGEFRTSTLNGWHFARALPTNVALNADFIKCVPPDTPFAVPSEDVLYVQVRHSVQTRRLVAATGKSMTF